MLPPVKTFGPFVFDSRRLALQRDGKELRLGPRGAALLRALLEKDGEVVDRDTLIECCWPGTAVEESNLTVQIAALRRTLGTRADGSEWIATVPRIGYRMVLTMVGKASDLDRPSIAVLPFANFSEDPRQDHFADGIAEDLITALSRFKTFSVVARNSSFVYQGRAVDVREAARTLGVRYVLEGSVRRSGKRVRVSAQLIEATNASHIWAEKYDGAIGDVFDFQDRITESVISAIEPQIRKAEIERSRRKRPGSLDAYDLYLKALPLIQAVVGHSYGEAIDLMEQAIAQDAGFAPAYALASWAHSKRHDSGELAPPGIDDTGAAITLAERALAIGGDDAIVLAIAGHQLLKLKDSDYGYLALERALALNPNSFTVVNLSGFGYRHKGEFDKAVACHVKALRLCAGGPETVWGYCGIANAHLAAGRFEEALVWSLRSLDMSDGGEWPLLLATASYAQIGTAAAATDMLRRVMALRPDLSISSLFSSDRVPLQADRNIIEGLLKAGMQ